VEFENSFEVAAPVERAWETLLDVERVAPCMPGAEVLERTGDDAFKVGIKVKVGPVSMQYRGDVEIVERDDQAHRAVMRANAKETRGQGTASADVEMRLSGNGATTATIVTRLQVRGRAASMGQGVMQDVAGKLVETFAANLGAMLAAEPAAAPGPEPVVAAAAGDGPPPSPPRPSPPPAQELSALSLAGSVVADRLRDPRRLAITLGGVVLILLWLLRRRR
jgi:carbon monoxide dehydrogenase subunit G